MSNFSRVAVKKWHDEVPGARWFRADLHLHTLDDAEGSSVSWQAPAEISESLNPRNAQARAAYVRAFLKAAALAQIEVLGLTPHSAHVHGDATTSVVWDIVEAWQSENDDDGTPFREKIYAIFPGFEPSVADGSGGIHLLFLFDPEIGKDRYLKAFTLVTGGHEVFVDGALQPSTRSAADTFEELKKLKEREGDGWDCLCIAPHAFSSKGLIESLKGALGKFFPHDSIAALELKDNDLPRDALQAHGYLQRHIDEYRQALIHNSDAYCLTNRGCAGTVPMVDNPSKRGIGYRHTFLKMASPRIEAMRQAFLSRDSRVRIAYDRDSENAFAFAQHPPKAVDSDRPWLRSIRIKDGTSFFAGKDREQTIRFSPDLTCVIGGRMTGKSTLLDGLRAHCRIPLPTDESLAEDVEARAKKFLGGNPTISLDILGPVASTLGPCDRWPARFFTQRELQRIAKDQNNVRRILFHLAPRGSEPLQKEAQSISALDAGLLRLATRIAELRVAFAEKEQALKTAEEAQNALAQFRDAGADKLMNAQAEQGRVKVFSDEVAEFQKLVAKTSAAVDLIALPKITCLSKDEKWGELLAGDIKNIRSHLEEVTRLTENIKRGARSLTNKVDGQSQEIPTSVQVILVKSGRKAEDLNQFEALSKLAAAFEATRLRFDEARIALEGAKAEFNKMESDRATVLEAHRRSLDEIIESVNQSIPKIRVSLKHASSRSPLDEWIRNMKESGITRWWNDNREVTDPVIILQKLRGNQLTELRMSGTVASRFQELMTEDRVFQLRALRSEDEYKIEADVGNGGFRSIEKLSGGKQISVVLSLLLESTDTAPLVIDQPEDELDKAFLAETLLPVLRRLKGRRQIIFATHDANIVVNGDSDQVIHLDATAEIADVRAQGAIDEQAIKEAVLHILDGGQDAFDLRKRKYGF